MNSSLKAVVLYLSPGGNTKRVAEAIVRGLASRWVNVELLPIKEADGIDLDAYDLVCIGAPSYHFSVPEPMLHFTKSALGRSNVQLRAPARPGRWGVAFITYGGPHTGIDEASPAGEHLAQFLRHLGSAVRGVWYTVGAFHGGEDDPRNQHGFLGDIRGRPNEHDLGVVEANAAGLAHVLCYEKDNMS